MMRSDYSKGMDDLRDQQKLAQDEAERSRSHYEEVREWNVSKQTEYEGKDQQLETYRSRYGALDGNDLTPPNNNPQPGNPDYITKAEVQKQLQEVVTGMSKAHSEALKQVTNASVDHMQRFGKRLDMDALEKLALENNITPGMAYEKLIAPKVAEQAETRHTEALKKAREEGAQDYAAKHSMPVDFKPDAPHPVREMSSADKPPTSAERVNAASATFMQEMSKR